MKNSNKGITRISLTMLIMVIILLFSIIYINIEKIKEISNIMYGIATKKINIEEEIEKNEKVIGTSDVEGEGIIINILDGEDLIHQEDIIIMIDELKNAGSQAISVNDQRITNSTYVYCDGSVILIDNIKIGNPFTIKAIGNKETIYGAITRNKGYIETLKRDKLEINVEKSNSIKIPKTNKNEILEYIKSKSDISKLYTLNKISGKSSIKGKGVKITIEENSAKLTALSFLQIINDLNSAGTQAISINGQRVTNMTDIMDISKSYILINSIAINSPFVVEAIGNQNKILEALSYDNSYITKIKNNGNKVNVRCINSIKIEKYIQKKDQDKMATNYLN